MKLSLCIFLIIFSLFGVTQEFNVKNSIQEQLEDFKIFKTTLLESHSGIFDYNDSVSLNTNFNLLETKLNSKAMTRIEQLALYSKSVAKIKCIHTSVYQKQMTPKSLKAKFELPFQLYFANNQLRSKENYTFNELKIEKNDQILSINNELIENIKDSLYQYISSDGNNISHKNQRLKHNFLYYYFLYKSKETDFILQYIHKRDTIINEFKSSPSHYVNKKRPPNSINYSIDTLSSYALLILPFPLPLNKQYKRKLSIFFAKINNYTIQNLVLDLRNNGGGKSQHYFAGFFIDGNIEYSGVHTASIHDVTYKKYFIHKMNPQFLILNFMGRVIPQVVSYQSVDSQPQYNGQLFVLINGNTASAASNLASILKEWGGGIIVGEESGGGYKSYNTGGGILQLPNSKIRVQIRSVKGYNNIRNSYDLSGVTPNFYITESSYFNSKDDHQLDYIINELISTKSNNPPPITK